MRGGGEARGGRRFLVRHMWPAARVEAPAPPSTHGPAATAPRPCALPALTSSHPPAPTTPPAAPQEQQQTVRSPRPVSPDFFVKDGREFRVGDCALFRAVDVPPFIGLIQWIEKQGESYPKLRVSWLYRPVDVKLNKGIQLNAAPNEIFYSFHQDETSAVSLLHPCKVAFLRKGAELSSGISSFVCRRVYDIDNKCLWWLTDRDYTNERQEEVNRLLYRTRLEMHGAVQSGGHSPKRPNVPSASQQLKAGSDGAQNCGPSKGKKRDRGDQGIDPAKRDRDCPLKVDESEPGNIKRDNIKSEIAEMTEKDGLPHAEAVEKLVNFMQLDQIERKMDFAGRVRLADLIAATESPDCLSRFMQLRGLPVLNDWLQETHKGRSGEGTSPKETDKPIEELILALLRALAKLPISLIALQSCSIGKSVNHLRSYKNPEIQRKAKCLVDSWKKRVDAEMKSTDAKPVLSGQAVSWSGKVGFPEISSAGNGRSDSSEPSPKNTVFFLSSPKALSATPGAADAVAKSNPFTSGTSKLQHVQPANAATNMKDPPPCKPAAGACGPDFPTVKEEKSCSSSQSMNNSQSCSSDPGKTVGYSKEDARSSTAASANASKIAGRGHRRATKGLLGSGFQKEAALGRSSPVDRSSFHERSSQSSLACEKGADTPHTNNKLIVRFPNPGPSPGRSTSGGSCEEPSVSGNRASSPVADKHEQNDHMVKMKVQHSQGHLVSDTNAEPEQINTINGTAGSGECDKSPCGMLDGDCSRTAEDAGKDACASRVTCSSYLDEKDTCLGETKVQNSFSPLNALIEIKYSEASKSMQAGDDTAMNLLASVAGEVSKSEVIMSSASLRNSSSNKLGSEGEIIGKLKVECDVGASQHPRPSDVGKVVSKKEDRHDAFLAAKEEHHLRNPGTNLSSNDNKGTASTRPSPLLGIDSKGFESSANTKGHEVASNVRQPAAIKIDTKFNMKSPAGIAGTICEKVEDGCTTSSDDDTSLGDQLSPPDQVGAIRSTDKSTAGKLDLKPSFSSSTVGDKDADGLLVCNKVLKEHEKKEEPSSTSAGITKLDVSVVLPLAAENGISVIKESKDSSSESSSQAKPSTIVSQDTKHSAMHSSKKPSDHAGGKEDIVSSDEGSSIAAKAKSNGAAKLDFDLNELGDEGNHSEPATSPVICSAIHLPGLSPFVSPILSGLPAQITVAAPAKGPFVPPENLLRVKPEAGWKGSAATSAFRPAEPRKILGMFLTAPDISVSGAAGKQSRQAFDIDLNVADDQVLEEDISQSSAQTTGSESGNHRSRSGPVRSAGIELDLNMADGVADNSQFVSNASHRVEVALLPTRPLPGGLLNTDRNSSRNFFDLNNGPIHDEASTEPAQRSLSSKVASSTPFLPQVAGLRMNSAEFNNMPPWYVSANPGGPVAMQSFLPARGEHPYPIETAPGTQRIIATVPGGGHFGSDSSRSPVISTSPAMVFSPPAYQYAGFPFASNVHLQTGGFPIGSTPYANSAPAGVPYYPVMAPSFAGSAGALPAQHARHYAISLPEGSSSDGHDSNWKWRRQGLDLNSGPGSIDVEGKDERLPPSVRHNLITPPQGFVEEQTRMYQMPGAGIKRKEPEGSWDAERQYKQLSWQ